MRSRALVCVAVATLVLSACGADADGAGSPAADVQLPPEQAVLDYQLGAAYPPPAGVTVVARDSTAEPASGRYSVCYVNGFQSQPDERDAWLNERRHLLLEDASGEPVIDPDWPDEFLLDTSTAAARTELTSIYGAVIDRCADQGFQAVEIDNLDSFLRSEGRLTDDDNLAYATLLAERAHRKGLAIGQKNSAEQAERARSEVGFDFAVTEECHRWDECSAYTEVYGPHVLNIEYTDDLRGTFQEVCDDAQTPAITTLRDRQLVGVGQPGYRFEHC